MWPVSGVSSLASTTPEPPRAVPLRLRHVDSLRAVAAGLVAWYHFDQTLAPLAVPGPAWLGFLHTWPRAIDFGRMGVMIFFAVSGFVICRSLGGAPEGRTRRFLIRRFCRLYPAYWVSLLGGIFVWRLTGQALTWPILAGNVTMVPSWLGQPALLGVYWTLAIEMIFYGGCLVLSWVRCLDRPGVLATGALVLVSLPRVLRGIDRAAGTQLGLSPGGSLIVLSLAVMLWGAVFRLAYDETGGFRQGPFWRGSTVLAVLLALALIDVPDPKFKWAVLGLRFGALASQSSMACVVAIFAVWVAWLRVEQPVLNYLGVISYSVYLFHPVAKYSLAALSKAFGWHLPLVVFLVTGATLTVGMAAVVYRWVERPAVAWGKRLTASALVTPF